MKHRDSILNTENNDLQADNYDITTKFWTRVSEILSKSLISAAEGEFTELQYPLHLIFCLENSNNFS